MTWPEPRVNSNGWLRGTLLSNSVPSSSVPCMLAGCAGAVEEMNQRHGRAYGVVHGEPVS